MSHKSPTQPPAFRSFQKAWAGVAMLTGVIKGIVRIAYVNLLLRPTWAISRRYPLYTKQGFITAGNVTRMLRSRNHIDDNWRVDTVALVPITPGAMGNVYRMTVTYARVNGVVAAAGTATTKAPDTFILKENECTAKDIIINALFHLTFYEKQGYDVLQRLNLGDLHPIIYGMEIHWAGFSVALFQDLGGLRGQKSSQPGGCSVADAESLAWAMGRFHGRTFNNAALAKTCHRTSFMEHNYPAMIADITTKKKLSKDILAKLPLSTKVLTTLCDPELHNWFLIAFRGYGLRPLRSDFDAGYCRDGEDHAMAATTVLVHADIRLDNAFFDDSRGGKAVLIDWAAMMPLHPGRDLVWLLADIDTAVLRTPGVLDRILKAYVAGFQTSYAGPDPLPVSTEIVRSWITLGTTTCLVFWSLAMAYILKDDVMESDNIKTILVMYLTRLEALVEDFGFVTVPSLRAQTQFA